MQRIKDILKSEKPVKWLFYGDSITHGALYTSGWRDLRSCSPLEHYI